MHSRNPGNDEVQRYGDFELSCAKHQFSKHHYKLFGCTPIGVWTVDSIRDGMYTLTQQHTTSRNPEFQFCPEQWPEEIKGYVHYQKAWIGAYELLHRLVDKTVTHVRTKKTPPRKEPNLQWLCLQVLAQNENIMRQNRKSLPSHLMVEYLSCRNEIIPIPVEFRIAHLAYDTWENKLVKAVPGAPDWAGRVWRFLPEAPSYGLIWSQCAGILLPTNPTVRGCHTGLALEPQQGAATFMDEYLAACRRRDAKFDLLFDYVWQIAKVIYGGCIAGDNVVLAARGPGAPPAPRRVRDVRAGDVVACEGGYAAVEAAWGIPVGEARPMVRLRGVWLTPDHPVLDPASGRWRRADALAPPAALREADCVYNLAVESRRGVLVAAGPEEEAAAGGGGAPAEEAVVCCTLGQGVPGMADAVWGTDLILAWMRAQPAWPNLIAPLPQLRAPEAAAAAAHGIGGGGERRRAGSGAARAGVVAQGGA